MDEPELHQHIAEPVLGVFLLRERLRELLPRDQAFAEKDFAEPITTGRCRCHGLAVLRGYGWTGVIIGRWRREP